MIERLFSAHRPGVDWRRFFSSPFVLAAIVALFSTGLGWQVARGGQSAFIDIVTIAGGAVLLWIALSRPVWGLAFMLGALPIIEPVSNLFPDLPFLTSLVALLGGVTVLGFIIRLRWDPDFHVQIRWRPQYIWAALFIFWAMATNPNAALLAGTRNWLWTLIQLAILLFLCSVLLQSVSDHNIVMVTFAVTATISAVIVLTTGVAEDPSSLGGLSGGANTAARYFLVGFVFWTFLQRSTTRPLLRLACIAGALLALAGVVATDSRSGFVLAILVLLVMLVAGRLAGRQRWVLPFLLVIVAVILILPDQIKDSVISPIVSLEEGSDTVASRYMLWQAGMRMFADYPVQGIGIGQFEVQLARYGADLLPPERLALGAHNTYVAVLSETGLIGLFLFVLLLGTSLWSLWHAYQEGQQPLAGIAFTWLLVLLVLAIGGITKHDHYDKVMWAAIGVGAGMMNYFRPGATPMPES